MPFRLSAQLLCFLASVWLAVGTVLGQAPQRPFDAILNGWNQTLDLIGQELDQPELSAASANKIAERLQVLRAEALKIQTKTESQSRRLEERLDALGPPPGEDVPPEHEDIAAERLRITKDIAGLKLHIRQTTFVIDRAGELGHVVKARARDQAIHRFLKAYPPPLGPGTLAKAAPELFELLAGQARAPLEWWRSLTPEQRGPAMLLRLALVIVVALGLGFGIRFALLRWLGRDPTAQDPTYAHRLCAGIGEGLASGVVPALIFGVFLYRFESETSPISGDFADLLQALCLAAIFFVLARAVARAILAPELPDWRLVALSPENARVIARWFTFLAAIFAIDLFVNVTDQFRQSSDHLLSVYLFAIISLEAASILALLRAGLWVEETAPQATDTGTADQTEAEPQSTGALFWTALRLAVGALVLAALVAALTGYANLGAKLTRGLLFSGAIVGALFLLRGLLRELAGVVLRADFVRDNLALRHGTRQLLKFWLRALLDVLIFGAGIFVVLTVWGVPVGDLWAWTSEALQGIQIGNVTISMTDILTALIVFVAAFVPVRMLQRLLAERVLPRTGLDMGLRHSLSAGFGYVGVIIAGALAITTMGLDLTNLALIFGALSVGIGFGLQNVVNNFVSGVILLIERPIKVGDWVVVGANEGFVKRIRLRATEIETFQRASILIPNSEIVSNAVVNWTYKDRYGRVDVPVGVAYGSDTERVMEILKGCLRENGEVIDWPAPFVLFRRFGDSALEFEARGYIADIGQIYRVQSDLLLAFDKALREAGIVIPFPQRDLHIKNLDQLAAAITGRSAAAEPERKRDRPARLREVEGGKDDVEV